MNRFYAWLLVMVVWVAIALPLAGWLYGVMDGRAAFWVDTLGLVVPFVLISVAVFRRRSLVPRIVAVPAILGILGLYALTARNLWSAWGRYFGSG